MSKWVSAIGAGVGSIILAVCVISWADQPTTQPSSGGEHSKADKGGHAKWGYAPFNKLSNISDEQRMKINEIHHKFLAEKKAMEDKQDADVMSLLTDPQKIELEKLQADEKAKAADKRKSGKDKEKEGDEKDK